MFHCLDFQNFNTTLVKVHPGAVEAGPGDIEAISIQPLLRFIMLVQTAKVLTAPFQYNPC